MSDSSVAAHLAATRITNLDAQVDSELARRYRLWHTDLTHKLGQRFTGLEHADLFVTCTANARSELLTGPDFRTIVHDQHLGRTLNRMTYFVTRDWPASRVQSWAFERLATDALALGELASAQLALAFAAQLRQQAPAPAAESALDQARALIVTIEEFFVLAHEIAHTALGEQARDRLAAHLGEELDVEFARSERVRVENREAIAEQMAAEIAQAVTRHGGGSPTREQLERLRELGRADGGLDEGAWLRAHPYLYEEVACDLIATELTLEHFGELEAGIDERTVLPAVLMALHNLTSLEYLTSLVDPQALEVGRTLQATMVRKSVWRDMTRKMYDGDSSAPLGELYVSVTQDHAAKLGDQVLFIVPVMWREARSVLDGPRVDVSLDEARRVREAVWSLADPSGPAER